MDANFLEKYTNLEKKFIDLYEEIVEMKSQPYKNNAKLKKADEQLMNLHIEYTKVRKDFEKQYRIHELIKSVESMNEYIRKDLGEVSGKPTKPIPQSPLSQVPNWATNKGRQRSRSFPGAWLTRKKGGKRYKKTRKH